MANDDGWISGIPRHPCTCEVRPTRPIFLEFQKGERDAWPAGRVFLATFPYPPVGAPGSDVPWCGSVRWPDVPAGRVLVTDDSPVEWRAIPIPEEA